MVFQSGEFVQVQFDRHSKNWHAGWTVVDPYWMNSRTGGIPAASGELVPIARLHLGDLAYQWHPPALLRRRTPLAYDAIEVCWKGQWQRTEVKLVEHQDGQLSRIEAAFEDGTGCGVVLTGDLLTTWRWPARTQYTELLIYDPDLTPKTFTGMLERRFPYWEAPTQPDEPLGHGEHVVGKLQDGRYCRGTVNLLQCDGASINIRVEWVGDGQPGYVYGPITDAHIPKDRVWRRSPKVGEFVEVRVSNMDRFMPAKVTHVEDMKFHVRFEGERDTPGRLFEAGFVYSDDRSTWRWPRLAGPKMKSPFEGMQIIGWDFAAEPSKDKSVIAVGHIEADGKIRFDMQVVDDELITELLARYRVQLDGLIRAYQSHNYATLFPTKENKNAIRFRRHVGPIPVFHAKEEIDMLTKAMTELERTPITPVEPTPGPSVIVAPIEPQGSDRWRQLVGLPQLPVPPGQATTAKREDSMHYRDGETPPWNRKRLEPCNCGGKSTHYHLL